MSGNALGRVKWKLLALFVVSLVVAIAVDLSGVWQPAASLVFQRTKTIAGVYALIVVVLSCFYGGLALNKPATGDSLVPRIRGFGPFFDLILTATAVSSTFYASLSVLSVIVLSPIPLGLSIQDQILVGPSIASLMYWSLVQTARMMRETFIISRTATVLVK